MFTGVFRDRSSRHRAGPRALADSSIPHSSDEILAHLLSTGRLADYRFVRDCEIGPFIVDYLCPEYALVVEFVRGGMSQQSRVAFLESLGYRVLSLQRREAVLRPQVVARRVLDILRP